MKSRVCIPQAEYLERIKKASNLISRAGLDVLIANSNEADFANVRYFSGFWPLFEVGGAAIASNGKAALMVGPESEEFAESWSPIKNIHRMREYRESADPQFPGGGFNTFADVFESIGIKNPKKIGIAGWLVTSVDLYQSIQKAFPSAEIIKADNIVTELRQIKSQAEIACLKEAFRISEIAVDAVLAKIKPGMTELQVVGFAQQAIYENGGEYEAHALYLFGGKNTNNAISRPRYNIIEKGRIIQLNLGGRIDGYSPSIGIPFCIGKMNARQKELVQFGLDAHFKTREWLKAGIVAGEVAKKYEAYFKEKGYADNYLYGPCHGLGMLEVEKPWIETTSEYKLQENMTFQVDSFVRDKEFGLRWETGAAIKKDGIELLSDKIKGIVEL
ncbi:MAG: Xaa-Pro peptidase family protein [Phycisphaerae bacterium]|jgi:Xaa-Pro aminopeptidase